MEKLKQLNLMPHQAIQLIMLSLVLELILTF